MCVHCGGSGILNVESIDLDSGWGPALDAEWKPRASWCHACDTGTMWKSVGLG